MRVIISARKGHSSPDNVAVDEGRGFHVLLVDLSGLQHSIVNPDSFVGSEHPRGQLGDGVAPGRPLRPAALDRQPGQLRRIRASSRSTGGWCRSRTARAGYAGSRAG